METSSSSFSPLPAPASSASHSATFPVPASILTAITQAKTRDKHLVVLLCGLSGSGKSTLARSICAACPSFTRLSIDARVYEEHGTYGVDYAASMPDFWELAEDAEVSVKARLMARIGGREYVGREPGEDGVMVDVTKVRKRSDVVLDMSFSSREAREEYKGIIREWGGDAYEVLTVVMRGTEEVLWARIEERRQGWEEKVKRGEEGKGDGREGGWEGITVERKLLRQWIEGFEWPMEDEGPLIEIPVR